MKAHLAWGGSLCLQQSYTASCKHSRFYTAFYSARHTLIQLLTRLDGQITCFTHPMSHATRITGRCQSSVNKRNEGGGGNWWEFFFKKNVGGAGKFSIFRTLPPSFPVSENVFAAGFLLSDKTRRIVRNWAIWQFVCNGSIWERGTGRRIICHSPGRRPQVQQSTFFSLLPSWRQRLDMFSSSTRKTPGRLLPPSLVDWTCFHHVVELYVLTALKGSFYIWIFIFIVNQENTWEALEKGNDTPNGLDIKYWT